MIYFAVLYRWLIALGLSEVKLITLCYCQSMLVFNWLLAKMVEYVGKRLTQNKDKQTKNTTQYGLTALYVYKHN
jgi:hypothetical protein